MSEKLSITVETEFSMLDDAKLYDRCIAYARELCWVLGKGVSVRFFDEGMSHPMASYRFKGAEMGRISFQDGRLVIPYAHKAGWNDGLIGVSPQNVWNNLFLPHLRDFIKQERLRLERLETRVATHSDTRPGSCTAD